MLCPKWNCCHTKNRRVSSNLRASKWENKNGREKRLRRFARPDRNSFARKERAVLHSIADPLSVRVGYVTGHSVVAR